jgi:hypothetical protein
MKTATKVIFASALMLSAVVPSISHAAYLQTHAAYSVDQTKTWALEARAQDVMDKLTRHDTPKTQISRDRTFEFYATGNTSVPGISVYKDDSRALKSR